MLIHVIGESTGFMNITSHNRSSTCLQANAAPMQSFKQCASFSQRSLLRAPTLVVQLPIPASISPSILSPQQRPVSTSAASGSSGSSQNLARSRSPASLKVLDLISQGYNNYNQGTELPNAVSQLLLQNPTPQPGPRTMDLGQGTWQVFYAPHIASISSTFGVKFDTIQYVLDGDKLSSNVRFSHPLLGTGWLSASGGLGAKDADTVELEFDKFWVDMGADSLRPKLTGTNGADTDAIITSIGKAGFLPQFAVFPVAYLDKDLAVFEFPPLKSKIAVRRLPSPDATAITEAVI